MNKQYALILGLLVSLGLNLLVAGIYVGRAGKPPHQPPPMNWAAEQLSPETRQLLRRRMREQLAAVRPLREELRAASSDLRETIGAEEYDAQAFAAALARSRDVDERYQRLIHENLVELSADLTREQRIALVAAVLQRAQGGRSPRRPPREGSPPAAPPGR